MKKRILGLSAAIFMALLLITAANGQTAASLSTLPEADTIVYLSPQRIVNDVLPKFMPPSDLTQMRTAFADIKKSVGIDPASIEYLVVVVRFHKPTGDLNFVAPDVMTVASGDFSADSLLTTIHTLLTDKLRDEKYGSKTLTLMTIPEAAEAAQKNPMLKSFSEVGAVALTPNTLAIGNTAYLKAAVDAVDGKERISGTTIQSVLRDPNALVSAAGSPLSAFVKSFGLMGTETTPRESRCQTQFGDFYAAISADATNFMLRGAMNADNPDTAKIINNLLSGLLQQALTSIPDKTAQSTLKLIRMMPRDNEIVWEADVPQQTVIDLVKEQMKPKDATTSPAKKTTPRRRRPTRKHE